MATLGKEDTIAEYGGLDEASEARTPKTPPLASSDDVYTGSAGTRDVTRGVDQCEGIDVAYMERTPLFMAEARTEPLKSEQTSWLETSVVSNSSATAQGHVQPQLLGTDDTAISSSQDYFTSRLPATSETADFAAPVPAPSSADHSPIVHGTYTSGDSLTSASLDNHSLIWKDISAQHTASPPSTSYRNARPTSVPNFQTKPTSRRREGPEYPNYPDQSFKALQSQQYPPPYRPSSPHPLRTRSSHLSQSSSFSLSENQSASDLPHLSSGAKTVGNTPAQSPGLFSPMFPLKKQWPGDSDDGRLGTPTLHPSHHKPPKE